MSDVMDEAIPVDGGFVPLARPGTATLETPEGVVVFTPVGATVHLNHTAALLWQFFDGQATVAELADDVAAVFELPPGQALDEVTAIVRHLAERGVLEHPEITFTFTMNRPQEGGFSYRPTPCGSCGEELNAKTWAATVALAVGDFHLGVRCETEVLADAVRAMLPAHVVDDPDVQHDFTLAYTPPEGSEPPVVDLYRDHGHIWRSPSSASVGQVLLGQLARYAGTPGLWWVHTVGAVGPAGAQLLPPELGSMLGFLGPKLAAVGATLVNAPLAVDPAAGEVIADPLGLQIDPEGRVAFAQVADWADDNGQPATGRHTLLGWPMTLPDADEDLDPSVLRGTPAVVASMVGQLLNLDDLAMPEVVAQAASLAERIDTEMPPTEGDVGDWLITRLGA